MSFGKASCLADASRSQGWLHFHFNQESKGNRYPWDTDDPKKAAPMVTCPLNHSSSLTICWCPSLGSLSGEIKSFKISEIPNQR